MKWEIQLTEEAQFSWHYRLPHGWVAAVRPLFSQYVAEAYCAHCTAHEPTTFASLSDAKSMALSLALQQSPCDGVEAVCEAAQSLLMAEGGQAA
jgi:hypothetical protein